MKYSIIAAKNNKNTIGLNGEMPWYSKSDMSWFKENTMGRPVIMGRKTWDSIPEKFRPLPDRVNIIVSKTMPLPTRPTHHVFRSLREATKYAETLIRKRGVRLIPEIMYMGGQSIYEQALEFCTHIYLTKVDNDVVGDTFFPDIDFTQYERIHYDNNNEGLQFYIFKKAK